MRSWLFVLAALAGAVTEATSVYDLDRMCFLERNNDIVVFGTCMPEKDCLYAERERHAGREPETQPCRRKRPPQEGICCPPERMLGAFKEEKGKGCYHRTWHLRGTCTPLERCASAKLELEEGLQPQACEAAGSDGDEVCCAPSELTCYKYSGVPTTTQPPSGCTCVDHLNYLLYAPGSRSRWRQPGNSVARDKCRQYSSYACAGPIWTRHGDAVHLRMLDNCKLPGTTKFTSFKKFYPTGNGYGNFSVVSPSGGKPVKYAEEFPHMALLGFGKPGNIKYQCGGSLIAPDFILTAAHCAKVQWALLGTLNRSVGLDDPYFVDVEFPVYPQLIEVQDVIAHPEYKSRQNYHDIALLRLKRRAEMTATVRPACLHTAGEEVGADAVAAGWGHTSDLDRVFNTTANVCGLISGNRAAAELPSEVLIKVDIKTKELRDCEHVVDERRLRSGLSEDSHMCAGGDDIRDTCPGDSGGPIMVRKPDTDTYCMFSIVGVVSFGPPSCGVGNPAVYTKVAPYVPWIESVVWPRG